MRARTTSDDAWRVSWHPEALADSQRVLTPRDHRSVTAVVQKLSAEGPRLGWPHSSAVRGAAGAGLRELRPRLGRCRFRPLYRRTGPNAFMIVALAPEANIDRRGFTRAVGEARRRIEEAPH